MKTSSLINELQELLPCCMTKDAYDLRKELERPQRSEAHLEKLLTRAKRSRDIRERRHHHRIPVSYPESLPVSERREEIIAALKTHQVLVITGETGSGKTTQIPKMCFDAGLGLSGMIGCTQPRRVAAFSIARRLADELKVSYGREVGCKVRFNDQSSSETLIKVMTDGILLAETQGDPDLLAYDVLIIDEAHERSLNIDFILGYLRLLLPRRPELKLVITSATIDAARFSEAFGGAPIIEVSGRLFPVEVRYEAINERSEEEGDETYVDAALKAMDEVWRESPVGDVLIFMPTEKDIRETSERLSGRYSGRAEVVPLFGRLSAGEQQRVFSELHKRKIVVATNIAETSLTIPGIRYVIDTGLARISRYTPRTRTKRLPVEAISQSSADQRAGRCGRIEGGICIRLYSEESYLGRPKFTQPEIQRANLAEVILRMKSLRLGDIESFPFIEAPTSQAIRNGFLLLHELGAIDDTQELTPLGRSLARLPVDPIIGRMILQAERERSLEEVLVIAAGLSIMDPRERPYEQREAADQAHRAFLHTRSDFLTLLNIWNAYHDKWEELRSQNQLRKFCKSHFLSFIRMREWADVHSQLKELLGDLKFSKQGVTPTEEASRFSSEEARYAAIHRAVVTGLLGHLALRSEKNLYRSTNNREVTLYPGSALYEKREAGVREERGAKKGGKQQWIIIGEVVETSKLFARTVAAIDPLWIAELGAHICRFAYDEPYWNEAQGRVVVRERVLIYGLEVHSRKVSYSRFNPKEAKEIFIRSALLEHEGESRYPFIEKNNELREHVKEWQHRRRRIDMPDPDRELFTFYLEALPQLSSMQELSDYLKADRSRQQLLFAKEEDLTGGVPLDDDAEQFPREVTLGDETAVVRYAYAPGKETDGVTLSIPAAIIHELSSDALDGIIPGLREKQLDHLLRGLPKKLRNELMPIDEKVRLIAEALRGKKGSFLASARDFIKRSYGVSVPEEFFNVSLLPHYLRPRLQVTGKDLETVATSREITELQRAVAPVTTSGETAWGRATKRWEREIVDGNALEDLPEAVEVMNINGVITYGYFSLLKEGDKVALRLLKEREDALQRTRVGWAHLATRHLMPEIEALRRDLKRIQNPKGLHVPLSDNEKLREEATALAERHLFFLHAPLPITRAKLDELIVRGKERSRGLGMRLVTLITEILELRRQIITLKKLPPAIKEELEDILPQDFLRSYNLEQLQHLPRYLKALKVRAERALQDPSKDSTKGALLAPYRTRIKSVMKGVSEEKRSELQWLLNEFRVSIFAQELGTAFPVSPKRIDSALSELSGAKKS